MNDGAIRDLARSMSESVAQSQANYVPMTREFAWVTKVNGNGTLDINTGTLDNPRNMVGVRMLASCEGVSAGDRVVVETMAHVSLVTGVLSNGNGAKVLYDNQFWKVIRYGQIMVLIARDIRVGGDSWSSIACKYTVPEGLRPKSVVAAPMVCANGGSWTAYLRVHSSGLIEAGNYGNAGSGDYRHGQLVWVAGL